MIPGPRAPQPGENDPDRALTARASAGDLQAFADLYAAHHTVVLRYAYYRLPTLEQAEDIAADAWVRALRSIGTFAWNRGGFVAWMITITRNLIADLYKSSRYRLETPTGEMLDPGTEPSVEDLVLARQADAQIRAAVADLNEAQRACVQARFLDQLTIAETAERLGRADGAVKTLQCRAVRTLARDPRLTPENAA